MSLNCKIVVTIVVCFLLGATQFSSYSHENKWEQIEYVGTDVKKVSHQADVEVFSAPSVIRVNVSKPIKIEIFTILGKLVSSQQLEAGSYEFKMNTHGVYLVKTGESTSKVAI